jgi:hypothetical protein
MPSTSSCARIRAPKLQDVTGHDGAVWSLADSDKVEVAHHHIELLHLAAHVGEKLLGGIETARRILGGFGASVSQFEKRCKWSLSPPAATALSAATGVRFSRICDEL